jgi:hypothetical protein
VSIEALKQELSALDANEQRHLVAFLVSLQEDSDDQLELTVEFKAKIERGEKDLREGRTRIRKS